MRHRKTHLRTLDGHELTWPELRRMNIAYWKLHSPRNNRPDRAIPRAVVITAEGRAVLKAMRS